MYTKLHANALNAISVFAQSTETHMLTCSQVNYCQLTARLASLPAYNNTMNIITQCTQLNVLDMEIDALKNSNSAVWQEEISFIQSQKSQSC